MSEDIKNTSPQADVGTAEDVQKIMEKYDRDSNVRSYKGVPAKLVRIFMIAFSAFVIYLNLFSTMNERLRRAWFVGLILLAVFMIYPAVKNKEGRVRRTNYIPWYDIVLGLVGSGAYFYYVANFKGLVDKGTRISDVDMVVGVIGILILFEACRRVVGLPLLCVSGAFLIYALASGNSLKYIVYNLFYTLEGVMGTPIGVCSTYIVLFIIFGAFLEKTGISEFFIQVANSVAGASCGGPAKVAVISSALCGMVSGSSVANTVTTGSVTIPLMKKTGYKPEFAAAVEASASTGGQIMPPIMGAAAFLMAEMVGVKYGDIALRAILPAFLYFLGIFIVVHLEAKKLGLKGLSRAELPNFWKLIVKSGYLLLPLVVLVWMVMAGSTMSKAAIFSTLIAIMVSMPTALGAIAFLLADIISVTFENPLIAIIPLVVFVVGVVAAIVFDKKEKSLVKNAAAFLPGVAYLVCGLFTDMKMMNIVLLASALAVIVGFFRKGTTMTLTKVGDGLEAGARSTISVAVACAVAGIIAGVVTMTGLGNVIISAIISIAGNVTFVGLFLTMLTCIILGMGVPTTANYVIMATTCAPILIKMGINPIAANMFVFYFGIIADITPPVALAAYAGSAIAKSNPFKTGLNAVKLAIAAFIVPYIFALNPAMLFIDTKWYSVILIILTSVVGLFGVASAVEGYMFKSMNVVERILAAVGGLLMIYPGELTDIIGVVILAAVVVMQLLGRKKAASAQ